MISIYDWFGYDVPIEERYRLIKSAGFDGVLLWWCEGFGRGAEYKEGVRLARAAGLTVENIHTPIKSQNSLSFDNLEGEDLLSCYLNCICDCSKFEIPTMVVHLPSDSYPINELGMKRLELITQRAEQLGINIAMENLRNVDNLSKVLHAIDSKNVGFCYDSCHHANYAFACDLLSEYTDRLMALHLHDNGGVRNQHQLPFDGNICWQDVMRNVAQAGYSGPTALEPMNWGYEHLSIQQFLSKAYEKARQLEDMRAERSE